jgi:hypothetical protein
MMVVVLVIAGGVSGADVGGKYLNVTEGLRCQVMISAPEQF